MLSPTTRSAPLVLGVTPSAPSEAHRAAWRRFDTVFTTCWDELLEARWAVFFDALGVKWEYEKEGFELEDGTRYLPDFWLPERGVWVEVKGEKKDGDTNKAWELSVQSGLPSVVVWGLPDELSDVVCGTHSEESLYNKIRLPAKADRNLFNHTPQSSSFPDKWGTVLKCPICDCENTHVRDITNAFSDDYMEWYGRGSAQRISMYCEEGCEWVVRFGQHKGYTFFNVEGATTMCKNLVVFLASGDSDKLITAYTAARQARFEYGENGAPQNGKV